MPGAENGEGSGGYPPEPSALSAGVVALCELDVDASVGDPGHGKRRHDETMRHWITSFQLVAGDRDYDRTSCALQDGIT